jgi:hypothetical protein
MNKNRKILTVIALVIFGAIIFFHYFSIGYTPVNYYKVVVKFSATGPYLNSYPGITDVRMPLFVVAVFYTGLFFILATPRGPK